jgi:hypothetical protein
MAAPALPRLETRRGEFKSFRWWLRLGILANALVGLALLLAPETAMDRLALPAASEVWVRYVGLFILVVTVSYIPAALYTPAFRFLGSYAIFVRVVFVVFFLIAGGGFLWFALFDGVFAVALSRSYGAGLREDLDLRP